jgi:serine/threonine-protein kinase RsbW
MKDNQLELQIEAKPENLSVVADFIATAMRQLGTEQDMFEVQTAVDEACTNVMLHAYSGKGGVISMSCELQDKDFIITIRDNGRPFDPDSVPPPDVEAALEERRVGGLGVHLMRKLMDDVSYAFDAEKGNKLVMRKTLARTKT